ncbi:hypothetical protein [Streptomyces sp. NPDC051572]|jgi:hypothetical protein|uniref:hypothetical protein n=1 Tax=Streptomyces sp. NPDC051572 TaxID=3155802 RepID=UPI0034506D4D
MKNLPPESLASEPAQNAVWAALEEVDQYASWREFFPKLHDLGFTVEEMTPEQKTEWSRYQ